MLIDLTVYSITLIFITAELAYGAWLINNPSSALKTRGYLIIYNAFESCITGIVLAAVLITTPSILELFGIRTVSMSSAESIFAWVRDRYVSYAVDLSKVARDLTLTGILAPLATTWYAASSLANIFSGYLIALTSSLLVASRFCEVFGAPLMSFGIILTGISKFRRLGPAIAISVASLQILVGSVAPYFYENASSLRFKYVGVPLSGIAQYFAGAVEEVVADAKGMGEFAAWISLTTAVAAAVSAGCAVAAGGLPETLISRLRL